MTAALVALAILAAVGFGLDAIDWPGWRSRRFILRRLAEGDATGAELADRSRGRLHRATVYVHLGQLEAEGLIEGREEYRGPGLEGMPRRRYRLTDKGRAAAGVRS